jgi:hypothetical protein
MKRLLLLFISLISLHYCMAQTGAQCDPAKEFKFKSLSKPNRIGGYGIEITKDNAVPLADIEKKMNASNATEMTNLKITGRVSDVCKMKGCWMQVNNGNGKKTRIRFKDYQFFVPRDCENQIVYAHGTARFDTTSVAMLQHYAEDAGKSRTEIAAITKPEVLLSFEADGVLFDKK